MKIIQVCILEVDLEDPEKLHNLYVYPLAPKKIKTTVSMLSDYCRKIKNKDNISVWGIKKLVPNLGNISGYVLHYKNL